jgi:hypothetical protein
MIYLILLTYAASSESERSKYARMTLESALTNLRVSGSLKVHLADDGSGPGHITALEEICKNFGVPYSITNAKRNGYGASYNLATQACHLDGNFFLMLEDDWRLIRPLDLDPLISALSEGHISCIRLGYLGWTQPLYGSLMKAAGMTFLAFDSESSEPHVWSGHPRLETKAFQRTVGPWPEGLDPGSTEFIVASRQETRQGGVVWPLDLGVNASQQYCSLFAHIGAVQARDDQ